ncbi:hypothetical protein [Vibrio owensii]|uniref:hypothetical protein n=1 Tax=Vibrio owensii TaxID=696485 RepID=UPI00059750B5|nr:hypothetical protein [Vibrio owensii]
MKYKLLSAAIGGSLLAMSGCGGSDSSSDPKPTPSAQAIGKMSVVTSGFQTFKPRTHDLTGFKARSLSVTSGDAPVDDGESKYVFENPETGEVGSVVFEDTDPETEEPMPDPTIDSIVDLSDTYSAINIRNTAVELGDSTYNGDFTLIQDKITGKLYPLTENGKPIYRTVDAEHEAWVTKTRFSFNADIKNIYLRHGEERSLHKAELKDGAFVISKVFNDYFRENLILKDGEILSRTWEDSETLIWISTDGTEHQVAYPQMLTPPFLHSGEVYAIDNENGLMMALSLNSDKSELVLTDSGWTTNGYYPAGDSMVRGEYKMHWNCSTYHFDAKKKTITELMRAKNNTGVGNAGQNSLFCMYTDSDDNKSLPKFVRFDILKAEAGETAVSEVEASSGTKLDANERMAVVSDNELMFYEYPVGSFTEFYVNFDAGTTTTKLVEDITMIKMQTMPESPAE